MRKIVVFNNVTLDGYYTGTDGDMNWAHKFDPEWLQFTNENAKGGAVLAFGRKTYEMMAGYWPTPMASQNSTVVAKRMNELSKIVFSHTMEKASWQNTTLMKGELAAEMKRLKGQPGPDMVILGSASIVAQLSDARLIDEYQVAMNPVVLGRGKSMFAGLREKLPLKLVRSQSFLNGNVFLTYQPV